MGNGGQIIPMHGYYERKADEAFRRYSTLKIAAASDPTLADEECFQILIDDVWHEFITAYERIR